MPTTSDGASSTQRHMHTARSLAERDWLTKHSRPGRAALWGPAPLLRALAVREAAARVAVPPGLMLPAPPNYRDPARFEPVRRFSEVRGLLASRIRWQWGVHIALGERPTSTLHLYGIAHNCYEERDAAEGLRDPDQELWIEIGDGGSLLLSRVAFRHATYDRMLDELTVQQDHGTISIEFAPDGINDDWP